MLSSAGGDVEVEGVLSVVLLLYVVVMTRFVWEQSQIKPYPKDMSGQDRNHSLKLEGDVKSFDGDEI